MGEHAGGANHENGVAKRGILVLTGDQTVARRERELHGIGKTNDHDQRRHHVEEHVETEVGPAQHAQREQDRKQRRKCRNDHE